MHCPLSQLSRLKIFNHTGRIVFDFIYNSFPSLGIFLRSLRMIKNSIPIIIKSLRIIKNDLMTNECIDDV